MKGVMKKQGGVNYHYSNYRMRPSNKIGGVYCSRIESSFEYVLCPKSQYFQYALIKRTHFSRSRTNADME